MFKIIFKKLKFSFLKGILKGIKLMNRFETLSGLLRKSLKIKEFSLGMTQNPIEITFLLNLFKINFDFNKIFYAQQSNFLLFVCWEEGIFLRVLTAHRTQTIQVTFFVFLLSFDLWYYLAFLQQHQQSSINSHEILSCPCLQRFFEEIE